jgi:hypothetical protein
MEPILKVDSFRSDAMIRRGEPKYWTLFYKCCVCGPGPEQTIDGRTVYCETATALWSGIYCAPKFTTESEAREYYRI